MRTFFCWVLFGSALVFFGRFLLGQAGLRGTRPFNGRMVSDLPTGFTRRDPGSDYIRIPLLYYGADRYLVRRVMRVCREYAERERERKKSRNRGNQLITYLRMYAVLLLLLLAAEH